MADEWKQVGTVRVDSGRVMVIDPGYIDDRDDYEALGVIVRSGLGDGEYPVMVRFYKGRVAELRVDFSQHPAWGVLDIEKD